MVRKRLTLSWVLACSMVPGTLGGQDARLDPSSSCRLLQAPVELMVPGWLTSEAEEPGDALLIDLMRHSVTGLPRAVALAVAAASLTLRSVNTECPLAKRANSTSECRPLSVQLQPGPNTSCGGTAEAHSGAEAGCISFRKVAARLVRAGMALSVSSRGDHSNASAMQAVSYCEMSGQPRVPERRMASTVVELPGIAAQVSTLVFRESERPERGEKKCPPSLKDSTPTPTVEVVHTCAWIQVCQMCCLLW